MYFKYHYINFTKNFDLFYDLNRQMKKTAIILAGGEGLRVGGSEPKQFRMLNGKPVLWWSLKAFYDEDIATRLIVVVHPNFIYEWEHTMAELPEQDRFEQTIICGGKSRWHSVYNALLNIKPEDNLLIAVHDGARPLITPEMITRGWDTAIKHSTAIPIIPLSDSIRHLESEVNSKSVSRKEYVAVQTPQIFASTILKEAYSLPESPDFTDDASVVEALGKKVALYDGEINNIKITYPRDLDIANIILKSSEEN